MAGAKTIWETFGPKISDETLRPFGDASVDGIDLDFESVVTHTVPFANELRSLMDQGNARKTEGRKFLLTAAPQCPYPDAADGEMLNGGVAFDIVFVQFYNNFCGANAYSPNATNGNPFNFDLWDNWAHTVSKNRDVKVFLGVPASPTAATSGYVSAEILAPIVTYSRTFSSFGGVMMWDATQAVANTGFLPGVKSALSSTSRIMRREYLW